MRNSLEISSLRHLVEGLAQHRHNIHLSHKGLEAGALHADEQQKMIA